MKKYITLTSLIVLMALAVPSSAQVGKSDSAARPAMPGAGAVKMTLVDPKGQAIRPESLPKDVQAQLERVRKAAESLASPPASGEGAAFLITIKCSLPPLKCTITLSAA